MKNIIITAMSLLLLAGPLMAQSLEALRESAQDMRVDAGAARRAAAADRTAVAPGRAETGTGLKEFTPSTAAAANPFAALAQAVASLLKLIFSPNGDIEIATPMPQAPEVDGTLADDEAEEAYDASASYTPLQPADYQEPVTSAPAPRNEVNVFAAAPAARVTEDPTAAKTPQDLKRKALEYFRAHQDAIGNKRFIGVVDFSAHSSKARFYIVDVQNGSERVIHVAHGKGSDPDGDGYATKFSNQPDSKASSLGFYVTGALYTGKHGRSMRLLGVSSTNSNALARAVVVHESDYVREANMKQGRSFGCLAVSKSEIRNVLTSLSGGALIYAGLSNSEF